MNKLNKIILAVLGGMDVVMTVITPLLLAVLWITIFGISNSLSYVLFGVGCLSALFRGIKIGWIRK